MFFVFFGNSGDLAPSTRKSLAIAIVRFWFVKQEMRHINFSLGLKNGVFGGGQKVSVGKVHVFFCPLVRKSSTIYKGKCIQNSKVSLKMAIPCFLQCFASVCIEEHPKIRCSSSCQAKHILENHPPEIITS